MRETPAATLRRRHVAVLLEVLVFGVLAVHAVGRLPRAVDPTPLAEASPPPPLVVDLESDPPARLELLPGIGPTRAAAIVRERTRGGPFGTADALVRVHGIGPDTVRRIRASREVRPRFGPSTGGGRPRIRGSRGGNRSAASEPLGSDPPRRDDARPAGR